MFFIHIRDNITLKISDKFRFRKYLSLKTESMLKKDKHTSALRVCSVFSEKRKNMTYIFVPKFSTNLAFADNFNGEPDTNISLQGRSKQK